MSEKEIVEAARALKEAHLCADALGGEYQAAAAQAYRQLLAAVGDVDEPRAIAEWRENTVRAIARAEGIKAEQVRSLMTPGMVTMARAEYDLLAGQSQQAAQNGG